MLKIPLPGAILERRKLSTYGSVAQKIAKPVASRAVRPRLTARRLAQQLVFRTNQSML